MTRVVAGRVGPGLLYVTSSDLPDGRRTDELHLLSLAPGALFVESLRLDLTYSVSSERKKTLDISPPLLEPLVVGQEHALLLDASTAHERLGNDYSISDCVLTVTARIHSTDGVSEATVHLDCDVMEDSLTLTPTIDESALETPKAYSSRGDRNSR